MNTTETTPRKPQPDKIAQVMLPHSFSKDERLDMGRKQNDMFGRIGAIEAEARKAAALYADQVKALKSQIEGLRVLLNAGQEQRARNVIIAFDPTAGKKTYYAVEDTEKASPIRTVDMDKEDYALDLPL